MADVFISYASPDRERVRPLAEALQGQGFTVWWDRALATGDDFSQVIRRELDAAKAVIVVWSEPSVGSSWVRDEASVARAAGRLFPVKFDAVELPLGFGTIHTEDFTTWNGAPGAPQVQILVEALRARAEGRAADVGLVQGRRRRVQAGRLVSALATIGGLAALVGVGWWGYGAFVATPPEEVAVVEPEDPLARLLRLVEEGKISGAEAVELSKLLQQQAFEQVAVSSDLPAGAAAPGAALPEEAATAVEASFASFDAGAREMFEQAASELLQDPDPRVRASLINATRPESRAQGFEDMWVLAREGGASAGALWRACAALMSAVGDERAVVALERARAINPQDTRVWQLLSVAYARSEKPREAAGAALVGEGLEEGAGPAAPAEAEAKLEASLEFLPPTDTASAFVLGRLGDRAAARRDWSAASERYEGALRARTRLEDDAGLAQEAAKLARVLIESGEARRACRVLARAEGAGATVDAALKTEACAEPAPAPPPPAEGAPAPL